MGKNQIMMIGVFILAIVGGLIYLAIGPGDERFTQDAINQNTSQPKTSQEPAKQTSPSSEPATGAYVDYSSGVIASTTGTKLLFFHASWCPQCRALEADIKKQGVPGGVTIIKVDYDTNQALRQKYGVTLQTTIVKVDDNGNLVKKYVAYEDPTLDSVKANVL